MTTIKGDWNMERNDHIERIGPHSGWVEKLALLTEGDSGFSSTGFSKTDLDRTFN
jgi:hypothetical protein